MSNIIVMAFSPRNVVGCLFKKGLQRGCHWHPRTPLATRLYNKWLTPILNMNIIVNPSVNLGGRINKDAKLICHERGTKKIPSCRWGFKPQVFRLPADALPETCLQVELRKLSWEEEKYTRCNRKPSTKQRVGERKLDLFPLQETASSDVIRAGIFQGFACQVGGVFQTCCLSTSVGEINLFL